MVLIVGAAEAGKSTFAAWLANALHARGLTVAIVDADVGQSEIGPPATVGFGRVRRPLTRTGDAELLEFEFVGVTSPGRRPWRIVEAAGLMSARARAAFDRVIVDTSGFIGGGFAGAVKQRKITAVDPDVVVAIQVADEAEHIVRYLAGRARPRVLRLPAIRGMRPRSPAARRRHRDAGLARHLEGALVRVAVHSISGDLLSPENIPVGAIAALHASNGETLALGVVDAVDVVRRTLTVRTTRTADEIAAVTVGETTVT